MRIELTPTKLTRTWVWRLNHSATDAVVYQLFWVRFILNSFFFKKKTKKKGSTGTWTRITRIKTLGANQLHYRTLILYDTVTNSTEQRKFQRENFFSVTIEGKWIEKRWQPGHILYLVGIQEICSNPPKKIGIWFRWKKCPKKNCAKKLKLSARYALSVKCAYFFEGFFFSKIFWDLSKISPEKKNLGSFERHSFLISKKKFWLFIPKRGKKIKYVNRKKKKVGGAGYRSLCLMHAKHALYHLSYTPNTTTWTR